MSTETASPRHEIIVIGASAGGVEALMELVRALPADLPAALFVVLHVPSDGVSVLPRILGRTGRLPAFHPENMAPILPGRIYVAPPDKHLLVDQGFVRVVLGPRENGHRPSVDPLFRSAARAYGPQVVGVVLSGSGDDGTSGLLAVKRGGGIAVVQDPKTAFSPGMPRSAAEFVAVDHSVPLAEMGALLTRLAPAPAAHSPARERVEEAGPAMRETPFKPEPLDAPQSSERDVNDPGNDPESRAEFGFSCPDCSGHLWEMQEDGLLRFRCRVGHRFSAESLMESKDEALEAALWTALNVLEENAALARRMSDEAGRREHRLSAARFKARADDTEQHAELLRKVLMNTIGTPPGSFEDVQHGQGAEDAQAHGLLS